MKTSQKFIMAYTENRKVLRKLGKDDIEKIWTITMVEIDQSMTKEAKE